MKLLRGNLGIYLLVMSIGLLFGHLQVETMPGLPKHGRYHASDMDDLQMQVLGQNARPEEYAAGADHPAWYFICGVHQKISSALGWDGLQLWFAVTSVLPALNLVLFLALTRQIGFSRFQAFGLTMILLGSGATVTWSVVLETHVLAPTGLLVASLILTHPRFIPRIWNRPSTTTLAALGVSIAVAASITITNGMLAALTVIPARLVRRPRPMRMCCEIAKRTPTLLTACLTAAGILSVIHLMGWYLWKDPSMRQFLDILGERRLLQYMVGSWWESILAIAWIAPPMGEYAGTPREMLDLEFNWRTAPAYASGLAVLVLTVCSLRTTSARTMFIPLFPLYGVALHAIYGLGESFLFSANYTWATVIAVGLVGRARFPRALGWIALNLGIFMLIVNVAIWLNGLDWIVENDHLQPAVPLEVQAGGVVGGESGSEGTGAPE